MTNRVFTEHLAVFLLSAATAIGMGLGVLWWEEHLRAAAFAAGFGRSPAGAEEAGIQHRMEDVR